MSNVQILNCDCMEYMAALPDRAFDLALVDPPYGIGNFNNTTSDGTRNGTRKVLDVNWNNSIPISEYFEQLKRVSIKRIIWGANYYNCFERGAIVWFKGTGHPDMSKCEIASCSFQQKVDYIHINWASGFFRKIAEKNSITIHPCQKPIALYQWLLKNYAKPGDRILDTHGGSCSSAIACDIMGFDAVICEIDKDYYDAAVDRFNRHKQQQVLEFV